MHTPEQRQEIRERFLQVDTANVADVLDEIGLFDQGLASDLLDLGAGRVAGWAYTITGQMIPYDDDGDARKMEACGGVGEGEVTVWSGGATGVCYFGELIALGMMERGSTGAVIDGGVRDVRWLKEHGFPVFGRYRTPVQFIKRWRVTEWQVPVYLPGATTERVVVRPGDFLLGDEDGLIVVPVEHVDDV
jgi:4-hydroxy-4-methyl-2-oxoglutarate aldolase